jgi:hypothetical protein
MTGDGRPRGEQRTPDLGRYGRGVIVGVLAAVAVLAALGTPRSHTVAEVRLAASTTPLSAEEQQMVALMDPADRARHLLQKRIAEKAEIAGLLAEQQRLRHEAAMSAIDGIR